VAKKVVKKRSAPILKVPTLKIPARFWGLHSRPASRLRRHHAGGVPKATLSFVPRLIRRKIEHGYDNRNNWMAWDDINFNCLLVNLVKTLGSKIEFLSDA